MAIMLTAPVLTDSAIANIKVNYPTADNSWVPFAEHIPFTVHLRNLRRALLAASLQEVTFDNVGVFEKLLADTAFIVHDSSTAPFLYSPSPREVRALSQLVPAYRTSLRRAQSMFRSPQMHDDVAKTLFALFTPLLPLISTFPPDRDKVVLCLYTPDIHPINDNANGSSLRFYLRASVIHTDIVTGITVVRIPYWLHAVSAIPNAIFEPKYARLLRSDPQSAAQINDLYTVVHPRLSSEYAPVPAPDVLESALQLWSSDKEDLYYHLDAAIAAAKLT